MKFDRPRLLVSVRDVSETMAALAGGVDIIDIKEPARGPLGAADPSMIAAIVAAVAGRAPVSAALGELRDSFAGETNSSDGPSDRDSAFTAALAGLDFVKVGLAGLGSSIAAWSKPWQTAVATLPRGLSCVPVVYADLAASNGPSLAAALDWAVDRGSPFLVIDTFRKDGRGLTSHCDRALLESLIAQARASGIRLGLAGALAGDALALVVAMTPDVVGVRGAACIGGRGGAVRENRVRALADLVTQSPAAIV